jgi:hypothetical protein
VPLQIIASRRGTRGLGLAVGGFFAIFLLIRFWPTLFTHEHPFPYVLGTIEIGITAALLLGMILINIHFRGRPRTLIMLLAATALTGAAALPIAIWLPGVQASQAATTALFEEFSKTFSSVPVPTADTGAAALFALVSQPARLGQLWKAYMLHTLLADYAIFIAFSWWAGQTAARRAQVALGAEPSFRLSRFRLESAWLWPLIACGALVLADLFFGLSVWAYAAWNIGLVALFLFGLQGMAILRFIFEKYRIPRFLWFLLVVGLIISVVSSVVRLLIARAMNIPASSGAGLFIVLAIPLLGISENWIRYRIPREAAQQE